MLRESVGSIVAKYGHEYFTRKARAGERMDDLWRDLSRAGFTGLNLSEQYGGGGLGITELAIVAEEMAIQGCPSLILVVSPAICGVLIERFGTEVQRKRWLPGLATGASKMAFALTEADAGTNTHNVATKATTVPGGYRLQGSKTYISGVDESENVLVVAQTGAGDGGRPRISSFIVPTDSRGLTRDPIPMQLVVPESQYTLFFEDVVVPEDHLLGAEGEGLKLLFHGLNPERIMSAAVANGIGVYALNKATAYAKERRVWNVPIGAHQGISHPLARAKIALELSRLMTMKAAWLHDRGIEAADSANMAKFAAGEAVMHALDDAIQTHGGNGLSNEYGLADLWAVARLYTIAPVSREMVLNYVAQHMLGLPRSY
jgi:alkylation response protein AidB-like acyl-CoA dehydrogenase